MNRWTSHFELGYGTTQDALPEFHTNCKSIPLDANVASSGDLRAVLVRTLAAYKDPRKIPIVISIRKTSLDDA
jgi:hypothetical protein